MDDLSDSVRVVIVGNYVGCIDCLGSRVCHRHSNPRPFEHFHIVDVVTDRHHLLPPDTQVRRHHPKRLNL